LNFEFIVECSHLFEYLFLQMVVGKAKVYDGVVNRCLGFDLMLFDYQENLPIPGISIPATYVSSWNKNVEYEMISMVAFFCRKAFARPWLPNHIPLLEW